VRSAPTACNHDRAHRRLRAPGGFDPALVWLIIAYRIVPDLPLWDTPPWLDLALVPVIVASGVLVLAGPTTPNPVIVRSGALFDRPDIVRGVLRVSRNPFFWGASLFSIAHMIILGDVASLLTFGSIGFLVRQVLRGAPQGHAGSDAEDQGCSMPVRLFRQR
jgi:uncharacterized membrane protein